MMPGRFLNQWVNSYFTDSNLLAHATDESM